MYDATENMPTEDEIVAAVTRMQEERNRLLVERDDLIVERDGLLILLDEARAEELAIFTMDLPSGRGWVYIEDAQVLAISPDLDEDTRRRLIAQVEPPKLTTCGTCGAPLYAGTVCGIHDA